LRRTLKDQDPEYIGQNGLRRDEGERSVQSTMTTCNYLILLNIPRRENNPSFTIHYNKEAATKKHILLERRIKWDGKSAHDLQSKPIESWVFFIVIRQDLHGGYS
jgi:hypothetical protein